MRSNGRVGVVMAVMLAAVTACDDRLVVPAGWGPLRLAASDSACPDIAGEYRLETTARIASMSDQHEADAMSRSLTNGASATVDVNELLFTMLLIEGDANRSVEVMLRRHPPTQPEPEPPQDTLRLRRTLAYVCQGGWLRLRKVQVPLPEADAPVRVNDRPIRRQELYIVGGAEGSLVGRLITTRMAELPIWCGDGCYGIPLPFTKSQSSTWIRLRAITDDVDSSDRDDPRQRALDERLRLEERRLESGLPPRD